MGIPDVCMFQSRRRHSAVLLSCVDRTRLGLLAGPHRHPTRLAHGTPCDGVTEGRHGPRRVRCMHMCAMAGSMTMTRGERHEEKQVDSRIDGFVDSEPSRLEVLQRSTLARDLGRATTLGGERRRIQSAVLDPDSP